MLKLLKSACVEVTWRYHSSYLCTLTLTQMLENPVSNKDETRKPCSLTFQNQYCRLSKYDRKHQCRSFMSTKKKTDVRTAEGRWLSSRSTRLLVDSVQTVMNGLYEDPMACRGSQLISTWSDPQQTHTPVLESGWERSTCHLHLYQSRWNWFTLTSASSGHRIYFSVLINVFHVLVPDNLAGLFCSSE